VFHHRLAWVTMGILLSASEKDSFAEITTTTDVKSDFHPFDFGLDYGAGAEVKLGPVIPFAELSYL